MSLFSIVLSMTHCAIHDRCNIWQGDTWLDRKSNEYVYRQAHLSVLARFVSTRTLLAGSRTVLLLRACECSVCLHVASTHLTAWLGLSASDCADRRSSPTPVALLRQRGRGQPK